ncbi:MAG: sigma-54 dependent transcriptional regulator [Prevotellaceae bacterium]|jgi:transcriptional regulator with PAS, ATPase and Fis domain|nr:sigma-54 dependent transcriptional regulator [Prevotellaceae bacterium]
MLDLQNIKQQFDIIGTSPALDRDIDIACQVAPTDLSVLITGESGTGKEAFPKIIHKFSSRKHGQYIAVNCGAIPEGTIDSELFGHEKGSFTGALETRKGYFEVADGGTIFLDEVAELPISTQVRLLRVLETGEFLKVGSSKMQKTNVRIIAATNVNLQDAIKHNRFREDLYYRLNTVPIIVPPLRERKEDIYLLFRKFATDFAERYRMPAIVLDNEARLELENYSWPGNIRQLKNVTEQISVIEHDRNISKEKLCKYLPVNNSLPILYQNKDDFNSFASERELLYKILFDMRNDVNELKKWMYKLSKREPEVQEYDKIVEPEPLIYQEEEPVSHEDDGNSGNSDNNEKVPNLQSQEKETIRKVLKTFNNRRKPAAEALGISERTLYRKIKEYDLDEYEDE